MFVAKLPRMLYSFHLLLLLLSPFFVSTPAALPSSVEPSARIFANGPFDIRLRNHSSIDKRDDTDDDDGFEHIESDLAEGFQKIELSDDTDDLDDIGDSDDSDDSDDSHRDIFSQWEKGFTQSYSHEDQRFEELFYKDCEGQKVVARKTTPFARGNNGEVFAGRQWKRDQGTQDIEELGNVAVKLSTPVKRDGSESNHALMVLNAAELQISVQSENVVNALVAFYVERDDAKISAVTVMELITHATDLDKQVFWDKEDDDRLTYYKPLLNGVKAIHHKGIGHLSLKPVNILLADFLSDGEVDPDNKVKVKITDFDRAHAGRIANMDLVVLNSCFTPPGMNGIHSYNMTKLLTCIIEKIENARNPEKQKECLVQAIDM